jgi:hypothetical protein
MEYKVTEAGTSSALVDDIKVISEECGGRYRRAK